MVQNYSVLLEVKAQQMCTVYRSVTVCSSRDCVLVASSRICVSRGSAPPGVFEPVSGLSVSEYCKPTYWPIFLLD